MDKCCQYCKNNKKDLLICDGCQLVYYCSVECQRNDWINHRQVCKYQKKQLKPQANESQTKLPQNFIQEKDISLIIKVLRYFFVNVYRIIHGLDQVEADNFKRKNEYYYEEAQEKKKKLNNEKESKQHQHKIGSKFNSKIYIPEKYLSNLEKCVMELVTKAKFPLIFPELINFCGAKFFKIKENGIKDKLSWDQNAERSILVQILKEGTQVFLTQKVKEIMQSNQKINSKQPLLLASPKTWEEEHPNIPLNKIPNEALESLNTNNYAYIKNFMQSKEFCRGLYKELVLLEKEGRFEEPIQEKNIRGDKILWVGLNNIDKNSFKHLYELAVILLSIPYQINKDTKICVQNSEMCQISCFKPGTGQQRHIDSSTEKGMDNGVSLTAQYICKLDDDEYESTDANEDNKNGKKKEEECEQNLIRVYPNKQDLTKYQDVKIDMDCLLILKSRLIPYEILKIKNQQFIFKYFVNGPCDTKENKF